MKKPHIEEHENHERWLVSYADFITLLFAFFTVLYATSNADLDKSKKFEESIRTAFGMIGGNDGQDVGNNSFPNHPEKGTIIEPPIKVFYNPQATSEQLKDALMIMIDSEMSEDKRKDAGFTVNTDEEGVRISFLASKLFPEGSAKIMPHSLGALGVISKILKMTGRPLIVEGHTDNQFIKSDLYPSNWELAAGRAATIVRYLIKVQDINADRLKVVSFADQHPVEKNDTDEHRSKNRRVEIVIGTLTK